ncbi:helix-turn-helix domain-containing protein [Streptomonospora nanhaiensis]|uniref:helix-turn-helix domain-containing protein n=1 Tax=Streptomonospora nanhaiensis TaxID=1323731 RepID=UPI001C38626E|nr:helix-turn-helix transcriptional regulator [Streptomonospora nanhaiensis]MBV2366990.1 helix-turn-helix transcriptional regulator [Streptomonospora nanhaiensis]
MVHRDDELGRFLIRARRAALTPERVGLPAGVNRRRVAGLRREEVALLAGVSVDYYTRIEQGRGRAVSPEVLHALADALRLNRDERAYLDNLAAHLARPRTDPGCAPPDAPRAAVRPELHALLNAMTGVPAYILGPGLDLLAWNRMGALLWPGIEDLPEAHLNIAHLVFLDPGSAALHADASALRRDVTARLRADTGRDPDDPRLCAVVQRLRRASPEFRELWETHLVEENPHGTHTLHHPEAGALTLHFEKLPLPADPGQVLLTYSAAPGSADERALRALAERHPHLTAG